MAATSTRRSTMMLYSSPTDPRSHRARLVIAEKDITVEIVHVDPNQLPEDLVDLNPYQSLPTLADRELVLYHDHVILEYLDERYPHPPLMPVDPVSRAKARMALHRIDTDWYGLSGDLEGKNERVAAKARKILRESIASSAPLFESSWFFGFEEISLLDCSVGPILWRLPYWGVELPSQAMAVINYAERLFDRDAFKLSLTDEEREMRG